jgi:hypothetical protein
MTAPTAPVSSRQGPAPKRKPGDLRPAEHVWRDNYEWLSSRGYLLRPRYNPSWTPSWQHTKRSWQDAEDGQRFQVRFKLLNSTKLRRCMHSTFTSQMLLVYRTVLLSH